MRDQFRIERYEMQLLRIRYLSVGLTLYAIAAVFLTEVVKSRLWMLFGGLFVTVLVFWMISGAVGGSFGKKSKYGKEVTFLPIGVVILGCMIVAEVLESTELLWLETFTVVFFIAINVYALYLRNYVRFVYANRDADYMAVYHVTLGNTRAYRLWYMFTILAVLSVAILPIWGIFDGFWKNIFKKGASGGASPTPVLTPASPTETVPEPGFLSDLVVEPSHSSWPEWVGVAMSVFFAAIILLGAVILVKSMLTKVTDAKTSMETDRVIDLKRILVPVHEEVSRTRDDNVYDENAYARRIRRTFKRTVFDRYGDEDIPELTPSDLLEHGTENREILLEKYEKARYSDIPCTADDAKAVRPTK
ncbi:MAG: hypothetical protein J5532_06345 [Lachnospiraceae bacterium]|nr:hypothetical protein [Lachnospiraceae bacterium]